MPSKITTIKRIRVLGDFMMFGIFVCLLIIFLTAYFNGVSNGDYTTIVDIDSWGEADVELILLLFILTPIFLLTALWSFIDWKSTWRARDQIMFEQYYFESENPRKKPADTILMRCTGCQEMFGVTGVTDEMRIECPHCNKSGSVKLPRSLGSHSRDEPISHHPGHADIPSDSPKVRIIRSLDDEI